MFCVTVKKMNLKNMEKWPVAPDGAVPNSVLRKRYLPVTNECAMNNAAFFEIKVLEGALLVKPEGESEAGHNG